MSCAGSVVLTQTHPAAPYVCRTGNITLRCQYDGVENVVVVQWLIGGQTTINPSTIPGHTALPYTSTYQEVVVNSYTNLAAGYRCVPTLHNGSQLQSNSHIPQIECECYQTKIPLYMVLMPSQHCLILTYVSGGDVPLQVYLIVYCQGIFYSTVLYKYIVQTC